MKKFIDIAGKMLLILLIIGYVFVIVMGLFIHFITLDDASYNSGDRKNAPYAVSQYTNNISIDSNGQIASNMTAQELWDQMKENRNTALEYIDTPQQLLKLMNAEMITQFIDTRSNPDSPIDWNAEELNDVNSKNIQGIIKLKRADISGNNYTMTYVDPDTFQAYIDQYNASGSEQDRNTALSHFTLETVTIAAGGQAATIEKGETVNIPLGLGSIHTYMGWQMITSPTSAQYALREKAGMNFDEEGFGKINGRYVIACTTTYGTVGDYIDFYQEDGSVIPCIIGDIKNQNDAGCNEWGHMDGKCIVEFVVDKNTWYNSGHANPGTSSFHPEWNQTIIKAVNGGSYYDDPDFTGEGITADGSVANGVETENTAQNTTTKHYAKVATWTEQSKTITSNDPDIPESEEHHYNMTSTSINYQSLVKGYTMPFDYLWTFLVMGENIDFTLELADLVYNSKMEITVYDNLQTETNTMVDTYTKKKRIDTSASIRINYVEDKLDDLYGNSEEISDFWSEEESHTYTVTEKVVTKTNTLNVALTKADVWMETYSQEYTHDQPTIISSNTNIEKIKDIDYSDTASSTINDDTYGHASNLLASNNSSYSKKYENVSGTINSVESKIYNATVDRTKEDTDIIETINYVASPPNVVDKSDPNATDSNFVKIFIKEEYVNTRTKIIGISSWLFEALEGNDSTADLVDLTKYLIYKATGLDYGGAEDFDINDFNSNLTSVTDVNGVTSTPGSSTTGLKIVEIAKSKLNSSYVLRSKRT